jgi:hypothetical protein
MSHGLVAALAAVAVACALDWPRDLRGASAHARVILTGACAGWVLAARLLDGVVLGGLLALVLARGKASLRTLPWMMAGAVPFLALLVAEQRCATGAWLAPTQVAYFARSDWPPGCHRLGIGKDIGCTFEHKGTVARFGPDGFGVHEAIRVVRDRAGALGVDILGFAPLALLGFSALVVEASAADAIVVVFVLAFALAYGLFYFGNSEFFGARHLFPAAPFVWLLVARGAVALPHRAAGWLDARHARGAALAALLSVATACAIRPWATRGAEVAALQRTRSDLRRTLAMRGIDLGILKSFDGTAVAAALDPWADGARRIFVLDDSSGLAELRRAHPDLPVYLSLPGDDIGKLYARPPPPGVLVELERIWPTLVRPSGMSAHSVRHDGASGGRVLRLVHAKPGAEVAMPFDVATPGDYDIRVDGLEGPDGGNYALSLDGETLPDWHGYAPEGTAIHGERVPLTLAAGRHTLVARCIGRDDASRGYDAELDALVGEVSAIP